MRRIGKRSLIVIGIVAAIVIPLSIFVIIPVAQGSTRFLVVLSGSMSPAMDPGDVAVVTRIDPSELKVGDIVAYGDANNPKNIVSHRVVEVIDENGGISFRTKGDANEDPDPYVVRSSDVVGKVAFTIPFVGYIFHYAGKPVGFVLLIIVPAILLIAIEVKKIAGHVKSDRGKQQRKGKRRTVKKRQYKSKGHKRSATTLCMMSILAMSSIAPSLVGYTNAYFSDSETSANNVVAAGFWAISGEIVDFIVPERVTLGQIADFAVSFRNTGEVRLIARAFVEIRRGEDGPIISVESSESKVGVGDTIDLAVSWDTSSDNPGNYWVIAWVCYDSTATPRTVPERFKVRHDRAAEIQVVEDNAGG